MSRKTQEPVTETKPSKAIGNETITTHPAFGQIRAGRVSGSQPLYGSDFVHQHYVTVSISTSELRRDLSRDWHYAPNEIIEVALTESQWATFVSSLNCGMGVPCTIERRDGVFVPGLPDPTDRRKQFADELEKTTSETLSKLQNMLDRMNEMGLPKGKTAELRELLSRSYSALEDAVPFIAQQFDSHAEKVVEHAKGEIHGYMTNIIARAGMTAITNGELPLQLTSGN